MATYQLKATVTEEWKAERVRLAQHAATALLAFDAHEVHPTGGVEAALNMLATIIKQPDWQPLIDAHEYAEAVAADEQRAKEGADDDDLIALAAEADRLAAEADRILAADDQADPLIDLLEQIERACDTPADEADRILADDTDGRTIIDDGARSGVIVERVDRPARGDLWIDFSIGDVHDCTRRVLVSVDFTDQQEGLYLIISGNCINERRDEVWTLDDLRRLHDDIGRILADERVKGALDEAQARYGRAESAD